MTGFQNTNPNQLKKRRDLLPWWIKFFCWMFMLMGAFAIFALLIGASGNTNLSLYGFETTEAYSSLGLFLISLFIYKGYTAYSLWFEKDNAVILGKIDAAAGIALCLVSMFVLPFLQSHFSIRLEILILIPYYNALRKTGPEWKSAKTKIPAP